MQVRAEGGRMSGDRYRDRVQAVLIGVGNRMRRDDGGGSIVAQRLTAGRLAGLIATGELDGRGRTDPGLQPAADAVLEAVDRAAAVVVRDPHLRAQVRGLDGQGALGQRENR